MPTERRRGHSCGPDCPICEQAATEHAEGGQWDNPAEQEWADRAAQDSYVRQLWGAEWT